MGTLHTFRPRPAAPAPVPPSPAETRRLIEEAAQAALDTADRLLAILDCLDGDADRENGGDAEPDLGAPEGHVSQVAWLRGTARNLELDHHQEHSR
ncbi:hypothetical protein MKK68_03795 [Methylobacterium sp. E-016]|uniref:hypothetical protein n=1 Tax=Methylobacterium sp. E-016 TaxID=2836556 RepID=UPI001FBA541C|nr:hypothetical protein [Methylobacterium sp. E-016]MCJ2074775.1 hypothetical protein [Methylobacterium sp. E-016]